MNEKEKKAIEDLKGIDITYFVNGHECANFYLDEADKVSKEIELILNLIEKQQKELDSLKEIEKSHKEENGKLRVEFEKVYEDNLTLAHELEQEKEKNKELKKYEEAYKLLSYALNNYIHKDKIKEKIENLSISLNDIENSLGMTANKYDTIKELNIKIDVLEELLEEV